MALLHAQVCGEGRNGMVDRYRRVGESNLSYGHRVHAEVERIMGLQRLQERRSTSWVGLLVGWISGCVMGFLVALAVLK